MQNNYIRNAELVYLKIGVSVLLEIKHRDIVIIGGGIIGAAISYYCSKAGLEITVLEKNERASGTSSRCDGNILAIDKDPGFDSQMSLKSQELVNQLKDELVLPFEYRCLGSILVCENDIEMEAAEKWVKQQQALGLDFRMLDREDLRNESPYLADDLPGGLVCNSDSTVNPYLLTYALFQGANMYGAEINEYTEVNNVTKESNGEFKLETTKGTYTAKKVVNACGIWSPIIGKMLGIDIPIRPRKGHIIVAARQQPVGMRKVMEFGYLISKFGGERQVDEMTEKYGVALVFEPTESQNFLLGSSREFVGFNTTVNYQVIKQIARRTLRFYPKMKDMQIIRFYAGLRPWVEDHLPIISHVDKVPGFYIAAGHEGDGISLAAITGKVMSEIITDTEISIPIDPLRFERFKRKVLN